MKTCLLLSPRFERLAGLVGCALLCSQLAFAAAVVPEATFRTPFIYGPDGDLYRLERSTILRLANEQGDAWETIKSGVTSLVIDPTNPNILWAVTAARPINVIKSMDKGKTWLTLSGGLQNRIIYSLAMNPVAPQEVSAATDNGVYRTIDGGFSWNAVAQIGNIQRLFLSPKNPRVQFALHADGRLLVSDDSGTTWRDSTVGLPTVVVRGAGRTARSETLKASGLFFFDRGGESLLAVLTDGRVFRSGDSGKSWQLATDGMDPKAFDGGSLYASADEVLFARGTPSGAQIYRSTDGVHWSIVPIKRPTQKFAVIWGVVRYPNKPGLLIAFQFDRDPVSSARLAYIGDGGGIVPLDYGVNRHAYIRAAWEGLVGGKSALLATTDFNGTSSLQTHVSFDAGYTWDFLASMPCARTPLMARPGNPVEVWLVGGQCMLMPNSGDGYLEVPGLQLPFGNRPITAVAFHRADRNVFYYLAGINGPGYDLFRYQYNPQAKQGATANLSVNTSGSSLVIADDDPKKVYVSPDRLSIDGGFTWTSKSRASIDQLLAGGRGIQLLSFRGSELRALSLGWSAFGGSFSRLVKSTDLGDSWQIAHEFKGLTEERQPTVVNPNNANNLVTAVAAGRSGLSLLESTDGGDNWNDLGFPGSGKCEASRGSFANYVVESIVLIGQGPKHDVLFGGCNGLWRFTRETSTWFRVGGAR